MPDIFTPVILQLKEIGAFNFLFPFFLTSAIFYGLLRKSQIFGPPERNVAVNSVIALVASFMVWAYPIMQGVDIETQLSTFFMQGLVVTLVVMVSLMIAGMIFPPDLPKYLADTILKGTGPAGAVLIIAIILGVGIFITSSLFSLIINPQTLASISTNILLTLGVIILLIVPLLWIAGGETKK